MSHPSHTAPRPKRLLLHACCGPCLIEPLELLAAEAESVTIVFSNSNIHPTEEYERRRDTLIAWAEPLGVDVIELGYEPAEWVAAVGPLANAGAERCRACYGMRLGAAARYAAENGFDVLATTLTVSPYQDALAIAQEGAKAASTAGIAYLNRDFRAHYAEATRRSREAGMYRQNYCGCALSEDEARRDRALRKLERQRRRSTESGAAAADETPG